MLVLDFLFKFESHARQIVFSCSCSHPNNSAGRNGTYVSWHHLTTLVSTLERAAPKCQRNAHKYKLESTWNQLWHLLHGSQCLYPHFSSGLRKADSCFPMVWCLGVQGRCVQCLPLRRTWCQTRGRWHVHGGPTFVLSHAFFTTNCRPGRAFFIAAHLILTQHILEGHLQVSLMQATHKEDDSCL